MKNLHQQQCLNHLTREAVARCPECGHFYCRECIAEHDDRVICAACLRKLLRSPGKRRSPVIAWLSRSAALCCGLILGWFAFFLIGKILLNVPTSFHDGTIWRQSFWQE